MCPCQSSAGQIRLTVVSSDSVEVRLYGYMHGQYIFLKERTFPCPCLWFVKQITDSFVMCSQLRLECYCIYQAVLD